MLFTLLLASAWASPGYPTQLATDLGMSCTPVCTVCHATMGGGSGTVVQDFGMAMMERGLTGGSDFGALQTALDAMDADAIDSDGDGVTDIDELVANTDPNPGGVAFCDTLTPTYGCIGSATGAPASLAGIAAGLLGLASVRRRPRA